MSEVMNDGGPAFPRPFSNNPGWGDYGKDMREQEGMTLRDYFAAAAMPSMIACYDHTWSMEHRASEAYRYADAMLVAREPKQATQSYDCFSGTNCGRDDCVAHGGHGADS